MKKGGNAVDAALATACALNACEPFASGMGNACEPFASGMGGGGFMVIYLSCLKKVTVINFREKAPALALPGMFISEGKIKEEWPRTHGLAVAVPGALAGWSYALKGKIKEEWPRTHGLAVAVPGALAGWSYALNKYGTKDIATIMARAIEIAEKGFTVSETFSNINKDQYEKLLLNAGQSSYRQRSPGR